MIYKNVLLTTGEIKLLQQFISENLDKSKKQDSTNLTILLNQLKRYEQNENQIKQIV